MSYEDRAVWTAPVRDMSRAIMRGVASIAVTVFYHHHHGTRHYC